MFQYRSRRSWESHTARKAKMNTLHVRLELCALDERLRKSRSPAEAGSAASIWTANPRLKSGANWKPGADRKSGANWLPGLRSCQVSNSPVTPGGEDARVGRLRRVNLGQDNTQHREARLKPAQIHSGPLSPRLKSGT